MDFYGTEFLESDDEEGGEDESDIADEEDEEEGEMDIADEEGDVEETDNGTEIPVESAR